MADLFPAFSHCPFGLRQLSPWDSLQPEIHYVDQAALNSWWSACLYLPNSAIKDMH